MPTKKATKKPVKKEKTKSIEKEQKPIKKEKSVKSAKSAAKEPTKPSKKDQLKHSLIPQHIKLNDKEKEELFKKFNITLKELPKIFASDPAIRHLDVKEKDVIKIIRKSPTAKTSTFYRGVLNE